MRRESTMAKKTAAKKPKRRLKRTVRRSLAAVLMITAIVVAAIPVPENLAEDGSSGGSANLQAALEYPKEIPSDEMLKLGGEHNITHGAGEKDCWEYDIQPGSGLPQGLKDALSGDSPELKSTVTSVERDGMLYLEWEFLYHPGKNATICKYNRDLKQKKVEVGELLLTEYQTVTDDQLTTYFTNPAQYTDKVNNPMDNLGETNRLYPKRIITVDQYSYLTLNQDEKKFLESYYKDLYAQVLKEIADWEADPTKSVTPLEASPSKLEGDDRLRFYCEHNNVLKATGIPFTLVNVTDNRLDKSGNEKSEPVWVAQSQSASASLADGYVTDAHGFLAQKEPTEAILAAVGQRAFAGVADIDEIVLPDTITKVGDQAFEGSGIVSITLGKNAAVGNRAFRGCTRLTNVTLGTTSGISSIGAEAFYGCSSLSSITFPDTMQIIGYGAFANCASLENVDLSAVKGLGGEGGTSGCELRDFAFYNDPALSDTGLKFTGSNIKSLGKGCFALATMGGDSKLTKFTFPESITGPNGGVKDSKIGEYVLGNREKLTEVTMPVNYQGQVPSTTFYNCIGLHNVIFPDSCGGASFKPDLFAHVTDETFFVRGPELFNGDIARPRESTWNAYTRVSGESGVPYVYSKGGVDCYEVAMKSGDGSVYRYEVSADGTLKSCVLVEGKGSVDIVIPKKVGNYVVRSIGEGCFDDERLRKSISSITIQDDSITEIADGAFAGLEKLSKVRIGNSVAKIGERAFADCPILFDVFFNTPKAGYGAQAFQMADTAFQTGGGELTFHGDIVKGYAPFEYAMNPNHVLNSTEGSTPPRLVNVCYKSRWDSQAEGTHLTVMVDRTNGDAVLLDIPKLSDLTEAGVLQDMELKDYCKDQEKYYYTIYDYDNQRIDSLQKTVGDVRKEYALLLEAAFNNRDTVTLPNQGEVALTKELFEERYGPWINERFCEVDEKGGYNWMNWLPAASETTSTQTTAGIGESLYDFFFEPMVVQAATISTQEWLKPYFEKKPYNFMTNYQTELANPSGIGLNDYQKVGYAKRFIDGTETIIVPEGITSIDVRSYADSKIDPNNALNYDKYLGQGGYGPTYLRDTSETGNSVPGLFSGRFVDYRDENGATKKDDRERDPRGNDVIKRVELRSVEKLPDYAFDNCEQLKSVSLGKVSSIGVLPFRGCREMTELIGNENFPVEKGILFGKSEENPGTYKIIECLMNKGRPNTGDLGLEEKNVTAGAISLLKDVSEIGESAFEGCEFLLLADFTDVDNLKEIPEGCFKDCISLADVVLPVSVNKIKENAFEGVAGEKKTLDVTIRGREVDIADNAFSPKEGVIIRSYLDSAAKRYADRYHPPIEFRELGAYRVKFFDYDGSQVGKTQELEKKSGEKLYAREPDEAKALYEEDHRPGFTFKGDWRGYNSKNAQIDLKSEIEEDLTTFVAQYESNGGATTDGKYLVEFFDGINGASIGKYEIDAGMSFADLGLEAPVHPQHAGYRVNSKTPFSNNWTINTVIDRNMPNIIALYEASPTSGGSTNTSRPSTNTSNNTTSGNSGNTSGNSGNTSSNSSSSGSSSSSTSSTSTSSTSATSGTSGAGQYTVFVENGSGSGTYTPGATVIIQASIPAAGMRFDKWTTESNGVTLASVSMSATTFTMPSNNVTVKANYVADNTTAPAGTTGTGNTTADTTGNGNTRVDIQKPGISNRDLATATTNGSTDNFIVKISETDEATRAVAAALTNKYGTLDNILYYAMDISLYDSTGTTKITDTTGLSVDITIPIPDSLVAYGGNNMAGAVINGDQLESLNESFTTINGVPCIRFRATHFSPYTIYVDTGNLVEGMLDVTPKTGDPIHPKWFLSLGLACLSMILFLKRDKKVKVKA